MRALSGGSESVDAEGSTVFDLIESVDSVYPGILIRLVVDGELRPGFAIAIDGEVSHRGLAARVSKNSTVRVLPLVAGG
jgi:molybdopterin converting factor small subunit